MPKYIRTEEGHIYEYVEQRISPNQYAKFGIYRHNLNSEYEQIIAQSDNLAELCDAFVMISENHDLPQLVCKTNFEYCKTKCKWTNFYGAIWTDKGLIYVAKMNDDGELVLI